MARCPKPFTQAELKWKYTNAICPTCGDVVETWYCSNCGLPKNNSSYYMFDNVMYHCGTPHFRRGFGTLKDYQLCHKCYAPNPFNANFCRSCGENMSSQARDKNGHSWVDLGLSVLWSTESLEYSFWWNNNSVEIGGRFDVDRLHDELRKKYRESNFGELDGEDAATQRWGEKWRTPTKEEFEELITKCNWEKCLTSDSKSYALKVTGPNGNSIIIPVHKVPDVENLKQERLMIEFWTSTSLQENTRRAYSFIFCQKIERIITLTAKQKKAEEFLESNNFRFKYRSRSDIITASYIEAQWHGVQGVKEKVDINRLIKEKEKTLKEYENAIEQQRKILEAMGDDSQERRDNAKKDKDIVDNLWLTTPIRIHAHKDILENYPHIQSSIKIRPKKIRPVADKKWKGKL